PRTLEQPLMNVNGAPDLALFAIQVAEHEMNLKRVFVQPGDLRQPLDRQIDLMGHHQVEPDDEVRGLAGLAAIDPLPVAELVPLPGLADGQAQQQRNQPDEHGIDRHARLRASVNEATIPSQRPCAFNTISISSRTAPSPPLRVAIQCARLRTSPAASAGAAPSPTRSMTGRCSTAARTETHSA